MNNREKEPPGTLIGIVGPCAAGKSTLVEGLRGLGYNARAVAQEHSYVQDMWQRLTNPAVLIFLDASHAVTSARKLNWTQAEWQEQQRRLRHARQHADLYLNTDSLTIEEVLARVLAFLEGRNIIA